MGQQPPLLKACSSVRSPHHDFFPSFQPDVPQLVFALFPHILVLVTRSRARHTSLLPSPPQAATRLPLSLLLAGQSNPPHPLLRGVTVMERYAGGDVVWLNSSLRATLVYEI